MNVPDAYTARSELSRSKRDRFIGALSTSLNGRLDGQLDNIVVYATGSMGRHELGERSDLDLFVVDTCNDDDGQLGNLERIELLATLIEANRAAGFPAFDGDGSFLVVHKLADLREFLGTRVEDKENIFTARMLLLLESEWLFGEESYERLVDFVIDEIYYRDERGREGEFVPLFLLNDIIRFWKTLCLAYENTRYKSGADTGKSRHALVKLRFSRAWTCFNGIAYLLADVESPNQSARARAMIGMSPAERMAEVARLRPAASDDVFDVLTRFEWFLEFSEMEKHELRSSLAAMSDGEWADTTEKGADFCDALWVLIKKLAAEAHLERKLLI